VDSLSDFINSDVLPHWPFFSALIFFMVTGQVMVKSVFTKNAHLENKPVWFWWWGRKTLPLHPIVLGILLGIIWKEPEPDIVRLIPRMGYFATAGGLSVWGYELLKGIAKKKGINLDLPGIDSIPPSDHPPPILPPIIFPTDHSPVFPPPLPTPQTSKPPIK